MDNIQLIIIKIKLIGQGPFYLSISNFIPVLYIGLVCFKFSLKLAGIIHRATYTYITLLYLFRTIHVPLNRIYESLL